MPREAFFCTLCFDKIKLFEKFIYRLLEGRLLKLSYLLRKNATSARTSDFFDGLATKNKTFANVLLPDDGLRIRVSRNALICFLPEA